MRLSSRLDKLESVNQEPAELEIAGDILEKHANGVADICRRQCITRDQYAELVKATRFAGDVLYLK